MRNSTKNKKKKKLIPTKWIYIVSISAFILITYQTFFSGQYSVFSWIDDQAKYEKKKLELIKIEENISKTKIELDLLKKRDPFEMEKKARENNMTKPGEKVYRYDVVEEENETINN